MGRGQRPGAAGAGGSDNTVRLWDLETGKCRATLEGHRHWVSSVAITPDGKRILSGSADRSVRVGNRAHSPGIWESGWAHGFGPVGGRDAGQRSCPFRRVRQDAQGVGPGVRQVSEGDSSWRGIYVRFTGRRFQQRRQSGGDVGLSGHRDGRIRLWNVETGESLATLEGHSAIVNCLQIVPDGRFAVSGSEDRTVKAWDLDAKTYVGTLEGHGSGVDSVAISPDVP